MQNRSEREIEKRPELLVEIIQAEIQNKSISIKFKKQWLPVEEAFI